VFYAAYRGDVYFASEIKALFALSVWCYAIARDGRVEIYRCWQQDYPRREVLAADTRSEDELVCRIRDLLDDAGAAASGRCRDRRGAAGREHVYAAGAVHTNCLETHGFTGIFG